MSDKIKLTIFSEGQDEIEVDREEYESAKAAGELAEYLDVYTSDIETDESVLEPDGTVVTLPDGNVLPPVAAVMAVMAVNATSDEVRRLAQGLLDIAELAMPDTHFAADSRCKLARSVLASMDSAVND